MARNKSEDSSVQENMPPVQAGRLEVGGTLIQGLESIPKGDITPDYPSQTAPAYDPKKVGKPPKQYIVLKKGMMMEGGFRIELGEGKVIDDKNYDIPALKRVGIKMRELTEED